MILLAFSSSSLDDTEGYGHEVLKLSLTQVDASSNVSTVTRILVQWIASSPSKTEAAKRSRVALNHVREMPLKDAVFAIGQFACASSGCCDVPQNAFDVQSIQCQSCDMMKEYNDTCSSGVVLALFPFLERALSAENTNEEVRVEATKSLGRLLVHVPEVEILTQSRSALTFLKLMFSDSSSKVREAATSQIRMILVPQVRDRLFPVLFPGSNTSQSSTQSSTSSSNLTEFIRQIGNHLNFNTNDDVLIRGIAKKLD